MSRGGAEVEIDLKGVSGPFIMGSGAGPGPGARCWACESIIRFESLYLLRDIGIGTVFVHFDSCPSMGGGGDGL